MNWGRLYLIYSGLLFVLGQLILYPFFVVFILIKPLKPLTVLLNKIWSVWFFGLSGIWIRVKYHYKPKWGKTYVYASNHGSYLDIPVLTWVLPGFICFIGKASLSKIPIFGWIFKNLHIAVDRKNGANRFASLERAKTTVAQGRSTVFFPEGTIIVENQPQLIDFKDGAFKTAIANQVPLVPITIPYNWIILAGNKKFEGRAHRCQVVIHSPIETTGMTEDDVEPLKKRVYEIISAEMAKWNNPEKIKKYHGKQRSN